MLATGIRSELADARRTRRPLLDSAPEACGAPAASRRALVAPQAQPRVPSLRVHGESNGNVVVGGAKHDGERSKFIGARIEARLDVFHEDAQQGSAANRLRHLFGGQSNVGRVELTRTPDVAASLDARSRH